MNSSCVIMSLILVITLFYNTLVLQGEIWCWSLLGLKGLLISAWYSSNYWQLFTVKPVHAFTSFKEYIDFILHFNNLLLKWIMQFQMEIWSRGRDECGRFLDLHSGQLSDCIFRFMYFRHFSSQSHVLSVSEYLNAISSVLVAVSERREDENREI